MEKTKKNCPYCGEEIMTAAKKCKHCGSWLEEREATFHEVRSYQQEKHLSNPSPKNRRYLIVTIVACLCLAGIFIAFRLYKSDVSNNESASESSIVQDKPECPYNWISNDRSAHEPTKTTDSPTASDPYDASNDTFDQWLGHFTIESAVYRTCDTKCYLKLEKNGENYVGDILIYLGNSDEYGRNDASHGSLKGKVRAKVSNGDLLVTIVEAETEAGEYANMFDVLECNLREGDQIFLISYDGTDYTTKAIGKMEYLTDGAEIYTTK